RAPPARRAAPPGFFKHRREQRAHGRRNRRDRRRACAAARPEGPSAGSCTMTSFNLSAWAIAHRSVVSYLMLALLVLGVASYLKLGRNEDPTFTIKTMVVQAKWPGATLDATLQLVTERLERKLQ